MEMDKVLNNYRGNQSIRKTGGSGWKDIGLKLSWEIFRQENGLGGDLE